MNDQSVANYQRNGITTKSCCLPELALAVFGWDLDHSRLVDDASRPVALLDNADDPRLVALLFLNILAECSRLLPWQRNQQTTCSPEQCTTAGLTMMSNVKSIFTSAKEVMFLPDFLCVSICVSAR